MKANHEELWNIGMSTIRSLEVDRGILASSKEEIYGCVFGRDSLISCLLLLRTYEYRQDAYFLALVRKVLIELAKLQGREVNIESGEEPGRIIHEFRPENHEHLTKHAEHPWFLYPDGIMRNYDTVDATPLFLLTLARYYDLAHDEGILEILHANILDGLRWILDYGLRDADGFISYQYAADRKSGGLRVQSWMDSTESLFFEDETAPEYSIAPVEVQAYAYAALMAWAHRFRSANPKFAKQLMERAERLKKNFNEAYVVDENGSCHLAFAIDGELRQLTSARSSMGHVFFADTPKGFGKIGILDDRHANAVAHRLMRADIFEPTAGLRTLSMLSRAYAANSYHNGSIWPHDTAMVADGLDEYGYREEARHIRQALLQAYAHFKTPIELFVYDGGYREYVGPAGQHACKQQAWSAAGLLAVLAAEG